MQGSKRDRISVQDCNVSGFRSAGHIDVRPRPVRVIPDVMDKNFTMERLLENLNTVLHAINKTLNNLPCQTEAQQNVTSSKQVNSNKDDNAYIFIIFVMFLFAVTVGSLILGYTRSKKVDKRSDPYHIYIKNSRVSVI